MARSNRESLSFIRLWTIISLVIFSNRQQTANGFVPPCTSSDIIRGLSVQSFNLPRRVGDSIKTELQATIEFTGEANTSIEIPKLLPQATTTSTDEEEEGTDHTYYSFSDWMLSDESSTFFLGTNNYRKRKDGMWDAIQPSVDWFGLELSPVFVMKLSRDAAKQQLSAMITEARSDIKSGANSVTGRLVSKVMGKSTFRGGNTVVWKETSNGWILSADLSLTVVINLPSFLPLPPGFNSIGSRIVKSTCRKRLDQFVVDLQSAYLAWVVK